jgi:hypothetical protein
LAIKEGTSLSPRYVSGLVKAQGVRTITILSLLAILADFSEQLLVIPKHFLPPMAANAVLGIVLWTTYSEVFEIVEPHLGHHPTITAALSGSIAGAAQAVVAAPVENVRLLIEGGGVSHSWSHAWKEVFRQAIPVSPSHPPKIQEIRQVRSWMKEVGEMAGRGWDGWGWGMMKDAFGKSEASLHPEKHSTKYLRVCGLLLNI